MSTSKSATLIYIIFLVVLIAFVTVGSYMEHSHLKFGHETGFILLFGILISVIVWYFDKDAAVSDNFQFDEKIFFELALPLILFSAGYNMRRK